jgi:hypothetical protein
MNNVFFLVRAIALVWSAVMITSIDGVAIRSEGGVELENIRGEKLYQNVFWATFSSFLTEGALKASKKEKKEDV